MTIKLTDEQAHHLVCAMLNYSVAQKHLDELGKVARANNNEGYDEVLRQFNSWKKMADDQLAKAGLPDLESLHELSEFYLSRQ